MKIDLNKFPVLFDEDLQNDLKKVNEAKDSLITALQNWISNLKDWSFIQEDESWIPVCNKTGFSIKDLKSIINPILYLVSKCIKEKILLKDLMTELEKIDFFNKNKLGDKVKDRVILLGNILYKLIKPGLDSTIPDLLIPLVESIKSRCIFVSKMKPGWTFDDEVDKYKTKLTSLHPAVIVELRLEGDEKKKIIFSLRESTLKYFKKALDLSAIQLEVMKNAIPKELLESRKKGNKYDRKKK